MSGPRLIPRVTAETPVRFNGVCPENVVFRDGVAVALLDFEWQEGCDYRLDL